jgi:hypothetical protein
MRYEQTIEIDAPGVEVWPVLTDVERWPEWTASIKSVERLDSGPFGMASRAKVTQPRLPRVVWEVSGLVEGRSFEWETSNLGMKTVASHELLPTGERSCRLLLSLEQKGPLAGLIHLLYGGLTRRYLRIESEGLKRRCETAAPAA